MTRRKLKSWQWLVLALIGMLVLDWFIQRPDARTRHLNEVLEARASAAMQSYPYRFRVVRMDGKTAVMTTPRSVDVPAFRVLGVLFPDIDVHDPNNPAFIGAQRTLGAVQAEAREIVLAQGVAAVRWELDRRWLSANGIEPAAK